MNSATYKKTILTQLHTLLKPMGFRKKEQCFSAEDNDTVLFVQLQSSSTKSTKDVLVVTVNLGIFSRTVAECEGNTRAPNFLDAHWWKRIGLFMPDGIDKWWTIHTQAEADLCGTEITSILVDSALPEMQSLNSTDKLKALWEEGSSPGQTDFQRLQYLKVLEQRS